MTQIPSAISIIIYRWAGHWGPFKITIPCGECTLTEDVITDTIAHELNGLPITLTVKDWLSYWWQPLCKGGWHAPIVMVDGHVISQGRALNRGLLTEAVVTAYAKQHPLKGTHLFGKASCPHCERAKATLDASKVDYTYHDVVREPRALYEMLARVKPLIDAKTPITVPQVWLHGQYLGGADKLENAMRIQQGE